MIESVRFCSSYDHLKWDFNAFKMKMMSIRKYKVDKVIVNNKCTRMLLHGVWSYSFHDTALHGPSMFVGKAKIYGVLYNQSSSIAFDETSSYWSALKSS